VLFVFSGRFSEPEKEGFKKLSVLKIASRYITLVRTKFDNFDDEEECRKDERLLRKESPELGQLFDNCRGIVYIDNSKYSREDSRKTVLDYLHKNCGDNPFKPQE
jgi:hypothetical protein